jgi:hypothetical protein
MMIVHTENINMILPFHMSTFRIKERGSLNICVAVFIKQTLNVVHFLFSELYLKKVRFRRIVLLPLPGATIIMEVMLDD